MNAKYFNKFESAQAYKLINVNPLAAKDLYEEYLRKYPEDYYVYPYYIRVLCILGEVLKAEEVLNDVLIISTNDGHFSNDFDKSGLVHRNLLLSKLGILAYEEKYEEAYNYYLENAYVFKDCDFYGFLLYCQKKIGILDENTCDTNFYIVRQIIDYDENDFLEHIKRHLADYNVDVDKPNDVIFNSDFPINKAIEEIKKYIPSDKKLFTNLYSDKYVFKYDRCGRCNDKSTNYFKVACFHNTSDFITMFPSDECGYLPCVDLNYMIEEKGKVKQLSQIEKFNRKWRR